MLSQKFKSVGAVLTAFLLCTFASVSQAGLDIEVSGDKERMVVKRLSASIVDIDYDSREVLLEGPLGNHITLHAGEEVARLQEFEKGDLVVTTYTESISGELREPTPEEVAVPWVELDAAALADESALPGVAAGLAIRAVCTIEGMNRVTRTVTVRDPKGGFHVIGDVKLENMEGVTLGQTIILTYTRAVALSLEKHVAR